VKDRKGIPTD